MKVEAADQDTGARRTRQLAPLPCRRAVDEVIDSKTSLEEQEPVARTDQGVAPPAVFRGSRVLGVPNVEAPAPRLVEGEEGDGVQQSAAHAVALDDDEIVDGAAAAVGGEEGGAGGGAVPCLADGTEAADGSGREAEQDLRQHVVV